MIFHIISLIFQLSEFVQEVCHGRDPSHGHAHMQKVAAVSTDLLKTVIGDTAGATKYIMYVLIVAWLHDVADHKYDKDGRLKASVRDFINSLIDDEFVTNQIMTVIDSVSFSAEDKARKSGVHIDWTEKLGPFWVVVRTCVSDADKLEALGQTGFERVVAYTMEHQPGIDRQTLKAEVEKHAGEKLYRLRGEGFIVTEAARKMAVEKEAELRSLIAAM